MPTLSIVCGDEHIYMLLGYCNNSRIIAGTRVGGPSCANARGHMLAILFSRLQQMIREATVIIIGCAQSTIIVHWTDPRVDIHLHALHNIVFFTY